MEEVHCSFLHTIHVNYFWHSVSCVSISCVSISCVTCSMIFEKVGQAEAATWSWDLRALHVVCRVSLVLWRVSHVFFFTYTIWLWDHAAPHPSIAYDVLQQDSYWRLKTEDYNSCQFTTLPAFFTRPYFILKRQCISAHSWPAGPYLMWTKLGESFDCPRMI